MNGQGRVVRKESKEQSQTKLLREPKHEFSLLCCYTSSAKPHIHPQKKLHIQTRPKRRVYREGEVK